jgi:hypothetical protein
VVYEALSGPPESLEAGACETGKEMSEAIKIRVCSVDDHPLMHEGIATVIRNQPDMLLVAEASNGREAIQRFREHKPDVTRISLTKRAPLPRSGNR